MHPADAFPRIAGPLHCSPLLLDFAEHLGASCIGKRMGLFSVCFIAPPPGWGVADISDDGLPAVAYVHALDDHGLLPAGPILLQALHLRGKRAQELRVGVRRAVLLGNVFYVVQPPRKVHR